MQNSNVRRRRGKWPTALLVIAGLVTIPVTAYAWSAWNYYNDYLNTGAEAQTNYDTRQYNKVWRPIGVNFRLQYAYPSGATASWFNSANNPFVVSQGASNASARCKNVNGPALTMTTCQTTYP